MNEALDEALEWDRDGQYFHYLTKWIHALCQTAFVTKDFEDARWAAELAKAAFEGFVRRSESGRVPGMFLSVGQEVISTSRQLG